MALELYSRQYWYPDATLAASIAYQVFPVDSNVFAPLWQDAAGTIPLPNPGVTSPTGFITFYAEAGEYWIHLDTATFQVSVGLTEPIADLSTGVASGGDMNPNGGNPLAVDISPFTGFIIDAPGEFPVPPVVTPINFPGATVVLNAAAQLRTITYWLVDTGLNVIQQATYPTPDQFRQFIVLGVTAFDTGAMTILEAQTLPTILAQPAAQLVDLMNAIGPFSLNGNDISPPMTPGLGFTKGSGQVFARAFNYVNGGAYTDNPHLTMSPAQNPVQLRRITVGSIFPTPPAVTTIDPTQYDLNGVLTPIPGGPFTSSVQRVYLFAANSTDLQISVQYGQTVYPDLQTAVSAIGGGREFTPAPVTRLGALIGYIAVIRSATDLSDSAQATFVHAGKFSTP